MTTPTSGGANRPSATRAHGRRWWLAGLAIAALLVVVLAPLASADPDGLERVARDLGFLSRSQDAPYRAIPDYHLPIVDDPVLATIAAGLVGLALVAGAVVILGRLLARRRG